MQLNIYQETAIPNFIIVIEYQVQVLAERAKKYLSTTCFHIKNVANDPFLPFHKEWLT